MEKWFSVVIFDRPFFFGGGGKFPTRRPTEYLIYDTPF